MGFKPFMLGKTGELHVGTLYTDIGVLCRKPCLLFMFYISHRTETYEWGLYNHSFLDMNDFDNYLS